MAIRQRLHQSTDQAGDGNGEEGRFSTLPVGNRGGHEGSGHGTGLHRGDEVAGQIGHELGRLVEQTKLSTYSQHAISERLFPHILNVECCSPFKVWHGQDAADDAGVDAEKGTGKACLRFAPLVDDLTLV